MDRLSRIGRGVIAQQVSLVAHADWSVDGRKRWCACGVREGDGRYRAKAPVRISNPSSLLRDLAETAGPRGPILVGFDFPIGLPYRYALKAGIADFLAWLPGLGRSEWSDFYKVADTSDQITLDRPFYPNRPGGTSRSHLTSRLGVGDFADLLRECERAHPGRRAACPLFWTLGGQQVGKAALSGWKDVLVPALTSQPDPWDLESPARRFAIWPFSGALEKLLQPGMTVVAETYPAEFYSRLGVKFSTSRPGGKSGKRDQTDRARQAHPLLSWAHKTGIAIDPTLENEIDDGFGPSAGGEDRFDAVGGLFGMLDVLIRSDRLLEPESERVRRIEGWIFGQDPARGFAV
jgi:hypothetical protein